MAADPRRLAATAAKSAVAVAGLVPGVLASLARNRDALVGALGQLPASPARVTPGLIAPAIDGLGERLVRAALALADDPAVRDDLMAAAQAGAGPMVQAQPLLDLVQARVVDPLAVALGVPDARLRAGMVAASLGGVIGARSVLGIEPLASASPDQIVALVAPGIQRLLDPTIPLPHV